MSTEFAMLGDSVARMLADYAGGAGASTGAFDAGLWKRIEDMGLPLLLVAESAGGVGAGWAEAYPVVYALGQHATPAPVAESMLAARLLAGAGLALEPACLSVSVRVEGDLAQSAGGARFSGWLRGIPWGADVAAVVASRTLDGEPVVVRAAVADAAERVVLSTPAGEPRVDLRFEDATVAAARSRAPEAADLASACALMRVAQIAGALDSALALALDYARQRKQFGKTLSSFQAIQQSLAQCGAEAAAVDCAGRAAFRAMGHGPAAFQVACAKLRANIAVGLGTTVAHQVHGAIGFTHEYTLRRYTQRLWTWRSEYGNDRHWSDLLGRAIAQGGAGAFWPQLTAADDAVDA